MSGTGERQDRVAPELPGSVLDETAQKKLEELVEEEEGATNRLRGWPGQAITAVAIAAVPIRPQKKREFRAVTRNSRSTTGRKLIAR